MHPASEITVVCLALLALGGLWLRVGRWLLEAQDCDCAWDDEPTVTPDPMEIDRA